MKLRKHIFAFVLLGLALQCHGADQQAKLKSYDHFKVVKIQTSNQNVLHELEAFDGLDFWKVSLMKGNIDVLVPPSLYPKLTSFLVQSNLTFSTMIQDVGKLINPKQVSPFRYHFFKIITVFTGIRARALILFSRFEGGSNSSMGSNSIWALIPKSLF